MIILDSPSANGCLLRTRLLHVPRLSIGYLMAWTAVTSAILASTVAGRSPERLWAVDWTHVLASSFYSTDAGWILLSALLIAWHAVRRTLWPLEPGEWLLAEFAVMAAGWLPLFLLLTHLDLKQETNQLLTAALLVLIPLAGIVFHLYVVPRSRSPEWHIIHQANLILLFLPWCFLVSLLVPPLVVPLLIAAVHGDRRKRVPRHWLHYSGVVIYGIIASLALLLETVVLVGWLMY